MTESIEEAALARAAADLPAPFGAILGAMEALDRLGDTRYHNLSARCEQQEADIAALHVENAELRDGMVALTNRIEAITRLSRTWSE